jgi:DnaJ-domain-containing protein 1
MLMEQIQLREELEELPREEAALGDLERLRNRIGGRLLECEQQFSRALQEDNLDLARKSYYKMQYFGKLADEVESLEEDLLGY